MSPALPLRLLCLLALLTTNSGAEENAYDVLGKVLRPYAQMLSGGGAAGLRAAQADFLVEKTDEEHASLTGATATLAVEMPDRVRITAPLEQSTVTLCRRGETIWAYPASRVQALLASPELARNLPELDPKFKLEPFSLPIPEKQLAFLPVLFQVQDLGHQELGGNPARVLEVRLQRELARSLEVKKTTARLWVGPEYQIGRIAVSGERGTATLRLRNIQFLRTLPPETWDPTPDQMGDLMKVSPPVYDQLTRYFMGRGSNVKK